MDSALKSQLHGSEVANSTLRIIREGNENKKKASLQHYTPAW